MYDLARSRAVCVGNRSQAAAVAEALASARGVLGPRQTVTLAVSALDHASIVRWSYPSDPHAVVPGYDEAVEVSLL